MSFILDALKKSETERQQQGAAEFAGVPTTSGPTKAPRWLWILGLLLAINLAVLLGLLMRPDTPVERVSVATIPLATAEESPREGNFRERVAEARQNAPARQETPVPVVPQPESEGRETPTLQTNERAGSDAFTLPTFLEVVANGTIELPDLHLDIHVFSEVPEDRFVFINMSKQREHTQLGEGPVVEEITPDGVVLSYQGTRFLLSRD